MTFGLPAVHLHLLLITTAHRRGRKSLLTIHRRTPSPHPFTSIFQTTTPTISAQSQRQHVPVADANRKLCLLRVLCPLRTSQPCLLPA